MLHVDLFRSPDRGGPPHRVNSSYSESDTIELAEATLNHAEFQWAQAYEVTNDQGDVLAVGFRRTASLT